MDKIRIKEHWEREKCVEASLCVGERGRGGGGVERSTQIRKKYVENEYFNTILMNVTI